MSNPVAQCTHVKTNGEVCGSPAVSGTELCYHHSTVKTTLAKARPNGKAPVEGFAPIPFLFPEDRASMQIDFFLLLQAYNEQRIDQRTYNSMLSLLKSMARNLGKTGSLVDEATEQGSSEPTSQKRDPSASSGQVVGHPRGDQKAAVSEPRSQNRDLGHPHPRSADSEKTVSVQASAVAFSAGPIAPESCFSTNPKIHVSDDMFRVSTLDLAMQGPRRAAGLLSR